MAIQSRATKPAFEERPWQSLTPDEKLERRFAAWLSASGIDFATPEAELDHKSRTKRYAKVVQLQGIPDRVPVLSNLGGFAAAYYGYTAKDMMYDVNKVIDVMTRATLEFQVDTKIDPGNNGPGGVHDALDLKMYSWPGRGLPENEGLQFKDIEYMKADEYDALIRDPSDYWLRTHLPRMLGALEPFSMLRSSLHIYDIISVRGYVAPYGEPKVQAALNKLMQAGQEALEWQRKLSAANKKLDSLGFPSVAGGSSRMPFDHIGDYLRGTRDILADMFRRPDKLIEAMERFVPLMIEMGMSGIRMGSCPIVTFPLHKCSDEFLSEKHFRTFYWPTFRKVIDGLVQQGVMVRLFAEGRHNSRLEIIREDMPKGKTIWYFDYTTDIALAKKIIGDVACIMGNVPVALLCTATPEETTAYCRKLIDTAGKGGGFVFSTGAGVDRNAKIENIRAMLKTAKEYGVYS